MLYNAVVPKIDESLRKAFVYEVRVDMYISRVWWTTLALVVALSAWSAYRPGFIDPNLVIPTTGWHTRNAESTLYIELWLTILANALQAAFIAWGGWLVMLGIFRLVVGRTLVKACFTLGIGFIVMALAGPYLISLLGQFLAEKYPALTQ